MTPVHEENTAQGGEVESGWCVSAGASVLRAVCTRRVRGHRLRVGRKTHTAPKEDWLYDNLNQTLPPAGSLELRKMVSTVTRPVPISPAAYLWSRTSTFPVGKDPGCDIRTLCALPRT